MGGQGGRRERTHAGLATQQRHAAAKTSAMVEIVELHSDGTEEVLPSSSCASSLHASWHPLDKRHPFGMCWPSGTRKSKAAPRLLELKQLWRLPAPLNLTTPLPPTRIALLTHKSAEPKGAGG